MKLTFKIFSILSFFVCSIILSFIMVGYARVPDEISVSDCEEIKVDKPYSYSLPQNIMSASLTSSEYSYETSVKFLNIFPVKSSKVTVSQRRYVVVSGKAFGIRLYTKGVMVVKIGEITTSSGKVCPATDCGLQVGDMITEVDGKSVSRNEYISNEISKSNGKVIVFTITRDGKEMKLNFTPALSDDGKYKGGLWVRDSTAGIGTITYYDRSNGVFAGLGHAVCDVDTGEIMPLSGGDAVDAQIKGCYKSDGTNPGELCGIFSGGTIGSLYINGDTGVYGVMSNYDDNADVLPVALSSEVKTGKAQIICTVDGSGPKYYDIEIIKVYSASQQRNLVIKVTDKDLLKKTGGIVQGMSGSPIIQNGMFVGAVTHVFVDNSKQGYGIIAENMIKTEDVLSAYLKKQKS